MAWLSTYLYLCNYIIYYISRRGAVTCLAGSLTPLYRSQYERLFTNACEEVLIGMIEKLQLVLGGYTPAPKNRLNTAMMPLITPLCVRLGSEIQTLHYHIVQKS